MHINPPILHIDLTQECFLCGGSGMLCIDDTDSYHKRYTPCHACCTHDDGFYLLDDENFGEENGKWVCRNGCGYTTDYLPPLPVLEVAAYSNGQLHTMRIFGLDQYHKERHRKHV